MHYTRGLKENEAELNLFQPARASSRTFGEAEQVGLHYHHSMEINLFSGTRGTARIGGHTLDLAAHPVLVTPPDTPHGYDIEKGGNVSVFHISFAAFRLIFSAEYREALNLADLSWLGEVPFHHEKFAKLAEPLAHIMELLSPVTGSPLQRASGLVPPVCAVLEILTEVGRYRHAVTALDDHMRRIIEFSESHWQHPIPLSVASSVACISVPHFCRVFKAAAGVSYVDYLSHLRVEKACAMLRSGLPVTEVCFESGFRNLSYFIQVFRRHTGITPGRFLEKEI